MTSMGGVGYRVRVFKATSNNISVISWRSVLLMEETGVLWENQRTARSHWQNLSYNVALSTPCHEWDSSFMKRKLCKPWWSSIPSMSTKRTITSHLNWTHLTISLTGNLPWWSLDSQLQTVHKLYLICICNYFNLPCWSLDYQVQTVHKLYLKCICSYLHVVCSVILKKTKIF